MRRALTAVLLTGAAIAAAAPAYAVDGTSIAYVERSKAGLQILVSVPAEASVDTDDLTVTIDGEDAIAEAVPADSTTSVRRTAVLVMDTSNSMNGDRIIAAQNAALTFLDTVPEDVYIGVVTFDGDINRSVEPTLDRGEARAILSDLELRDQTRLYDGVSAGVDMAGTEGQRQLLVLSDGADTSETPLDDVTATIGGADLLVNVVSLEQDRPAALAALDELAAAGGGRVISADSGALNRAFSDEADILATQVLVTAQVPDTVTSTGATVSVTLGSDVGDLTAEAYSPIGKVTKPSPAAEPEAVVPTVPAASSPMVLGSMWLYGGLAALGVGLLVMLVMVAPRRTAPLTGAELATAYTERVTGVGTGAGAEGTGSEQALAQARQTADKVLKANTSLEARISERLDGAGNPFKPAEWLLLHVGIFIASGVLGLLISGGNLILGILFLMVGAIGPWFYLGFKRNRRRKAFERSLPDTLQLISGSLAAGLSLAQSIDTVVREGQEPISSEFGRVLVETRLGITLDDALEGIADRFESKDFGWVVMAIRIQRQVGGNLAELLDTVAATMREREYMRRQVAALAAEGKLSAYVLGGLPPLFMVYLFFTNRPYLMPLFTEPLGLLILGAMVLLLSVGIFWMSRLIKVEV